MAIETYSAQSMEQRLANRLLMLSASFGQDVGGPLSLKINLHLPQEVLAGLIVTTRRRVGQILNDWQNQKLVAHGYGHIPLRVALVLVGLALSMGRR